MRYSTNMKYTTATTGAGLGCLSMIGFYLGVVYLLSLWTDRNLDFWFSYFKGTPVDVPQWISFLTTLLAPVALVGNILMELFKFAI